MTSRIHVSVHVFIHVPSAEIEISKCTKRTTDILFLGTAPHTAPFTVHFHSNDNRGHLLVPLMRRME